ncbi:MAG: UDP-N-acetylmuramoyl-L-alanine--D-glutamate ligase [Atopobiaceae bacterium]|nr:UDP-N-acetylmuramoyl-L-alanine--D-glutamate ligase [Atopobiaceae bacterium]
MQVTNKDALGKVCVLGFGRTGFGVVEYLAGLSAERVESIVLFGGASAWASEKTAELEARGIRVVCGTDELDDEFDLAIVSPGIPPTSAFFASAVAHAREVIGEPEFAWRESPQRWVGITGTNGKTTTTMLVTALLEAGGLDAKAVGNIGVVATGEIAQRPEGQWFVAELSSFQLATTQRLHPRVGILLNVTPDHLEWHGSLEEYAKAKERLFENFDEADLAIVSVDDGWSRDVAERLEERGLRVCRVSVHGDPGSANAAYVEGGWLRIRAGVCVQALIRRENLSLEGEHNVQNALCAAALALDLGVSLDAVSDVLASFKPLEHRIEPCGEHNGVRFVNDSKATNVDSVEKALTAFESGTVIVLLGGHDKGTELTTLAQAVSSHCRVAVCYGEAGPRIAAALRAVDGTTGLEVVDAVHLADALEAAVKRACPGEVVLLSPACSSFDEFKSFQERGAVFKGLVANMFGGEGA